MLYIRSTTPLNISLNAAFRLTILCTLGATQGNNNKEYDAHFDVGPTVEETTSITFHLRKSATAMAELLPEGSQS